MKIFIKAFLLLVITSTLFGCSQSTKNHFQNSSKIELEFWTLQLKDFEPFLKNKIKEYENIHQEIKIKWVDVPFSEGEKRTLSVLMSKNVPDIINLTPSFSSILQQKKALYEIDKEVNKIYISTALQLCKNNNGKFYAIPWYVTSPITIYNKSLLKGTGYKAPPKTYNRILPFAFVLKKQTNKYAFMPNLATDGAMLKILQKQNVKTQDFFTSPKTQKNYVLFKKLYNYNLIPKESINQGHRESLEKYMAGETVFLEAGANFLKIIKENAPDIYKNTEIMPQLNTQNSVTSISLMNLVIPQKSKHKKEALAFALYITNAKNQLDFCKIAPVLPSTAKSLEDSFFIKEKSLIDKGRKISAQQLKKAQTTQNIEPNQKQINQLIDYTTQKILLNKSTIEDALRKSAKEFDNL